VLVFVLQLTSNISESLVYYPDSWNPLTMVTSSLAHANLLHLAGNLIFFLAFAPALELLIGNRIRYIGIMLLISCVVGISYSLSVLIGRSPDLPSLGFSGVVMGMIGLSAFMMPQARIKVFWWYLLAWKTFYIPAWIVAACYIGLDVFTLLFSSDFAGINIVAHVMGGVTGYLYGYLFLQERREDTREQLEQEIEAMRIEQKQGKTSSEAHRYKRHLDEVDTSKRQKQDHDRFMRNLYQMVKTHRNSQAVLTLLTRYGPNTPLHELEAQFEHIAKWGPSRTLLCLGRLIIEIMDREKRYGRVIMQIEKCQAISPAFILHDVSRTLFFANMAIDMGKPGVARNLVMNPQKRYGSLLNKDQCNHLLQKAR